ncbi:MAG: hypothetical protein RI885_2769 [Actinomycetota bacterium]
MQPAGRGQAGRPAQPGRAIQPGPIQRGRIQPARRIAFEVISAVGASDAYANLLLPVKLERARLGAQDAALATELTYGTLRMQGYYDAVIELAAGRATDRIDPAILDVLRLGAHQLLSMRTAQHAAVDESVSLARDVGSRSASGFANAVLRTITRSDPADWHERVMSGVASDDHRLSLEYSHPVWIVRAFRRALAAEGREIELADLLAADNVAPQVTLVALPGLTDRSELRGARPARYSPFAAVSEGGDPARSTPVLAGRARVQDEGSQLAALALTRATTVAGAPPPQSGERWLDLCAGPGGKTALLAAEALAVGATLVANEVVPARAGLVRNALAVFDDPPRVLEQDGRLVGRAMARQFDRILVDAPCTGLGALRRRPEARWRKQPRDVAELATLQAELLESAIDALAPGGIVAYVTCSPHLGETVAITRAAIARHPDSLVALDTAGVLAEVTDAPLDTAGEGSHVQLWPHRTGTDAMFISLLQKRT